MLLNIVIFTYIFQVTILPLIDVHGSNGVIKYVNLWNQSLLVYLYNVLQDSKRK